MIKIWHWLFRKQFSEGIEIGMAIQKKVEKRKKHNGKVRKPNKQKKTRNKQSRKQQAFHSRASQKR